MAAGSETARSCCRTTPSFGARPTRPRLTAASWSRASACTATLTSRAAANCARTSAATKSFSRVTTSAATARISLRMRDRLSGPAILAGPFTPGVCAGAAAAAPPARTPGLHGRNGRARVVHPRHQAQGHSEHDAVGLPDPVHHALPGGNFVELRDRGGGPGPAAAPKKATAYVPLEPGIRDVYS